MLDHIDRCYRLPQSGAYQVPAPITTPAKPPQTTAPSHHVLHSPAPTAQTQNLPPNLLHLTSRPCPKPPPPLHGRLRGRLLHPPRPRLSPFRPPPRRCRPLPLPPINPRTRPPLAGHLSGHHRRRNRHLLSPRRCHPYRHPHVRRGARGAREG